MGTCMTEAELAAGRDDSGEYLHYGCGGELVEVTLSDHSQRHFICRLCEAHHTRPHESERGWRA